PTPSLRVQRTSNAPARCTGTCGGIVPSNSGSRTHSTRSGSTARTRGSQPNSAKCGKLIRTRCMSGAFTGGKWGETISNRRIYFKKECTNNPVFDPEMSCERQSSTHLTSEACPGERLSRRTFRKEVSLLSASWRDEFHALCSSEVVAARCLFLLSRQRPRPFANWANDK